MYTCHFARVYLLLIIIVRYTDYYCLLYSHRLLQIYYGYIYTFLNIIIFKYYY